jgi:uncharacterized protein YkwD
MIDPARGQGWSMRTLMLLALLVAAAPPAATDEPPSLGQQVVAEINRVRADPEGYADELRAYRQSFDGNLAKARGEPRMMTTEGIAAVDDAIAFLSRQPPLPPYESSELLSHAAQAMANAQGPTGAVGHRAPDGSLPGDRAKRLGGDIFVGETIAYGPDRAAPVVRMLVVDDGQSDRGHRKIVLSGYYRFAGAGCGPHQRYGHLCVIDYGVSANGGPRIPTASPPPPPP